MNNTNIQALEARQKLGELLELVFYQSQQFRITRKNKVMARLVGEPFMKVIEQLIADDPGLGDTIAILLNDEVRQALDESEKDVRAGRVRKRTRPA